MRCVQTKGVLLERKNKLPINLSSYWLVFGLTSHMQELFMWGRVTPGRLISKVTHGKLFELTLRNILITHIASISQLTVIFANLFCHITLHSYLLSLSWELSNEAGMVWIYLSKLVSALHLSVKKWISTDIKMC